MFIFSFYQYKIQFVESLVNFQRYHEILWLRNAGSIAHLHLSVAAGQFTDEPIQPIYSIPPALLQWTADVARLAFSCLQRELRSPRNM